MAKRKRLIPPRGDVFSAELGTASAAVPARAPIAQVAGDAAVTAAFDELQSEWQAAQRDGRMVLELALDAIREDYLIRDRLSCNAEDLTALKESIRARGQQSPIEVTDLGGGRYGLISGWRRLRALRDLHEDSGGRRCYATVQALLRLPDDRPAAYVAMVEENEIRADLSFYERARIVVQAVRTGVFDSDKQALQSLFSTASFSKRSKVKSFMPLVTALDGVLRYPGQIPERLGLSLSKALTEDPGFAARLTGALRPGHEMNPEDERAVLEQALSRPKSPVSAAKPSLSKPAAVAPGIRLRSRAGRVELEGDGVTEALIARLTDWLKTQY
ncbi:ParB/RepB/Spo0J family partition protein [Thalassovita gelatinovora]|uniref:ParB/RepB/Spo0J family partition protein n=1 Tax=Thalassovita gelatinovora TaxID=53501 RepID=UPI0008C9A3BA|nr:ParB N-terminal domain-containing protein [Thalassovita gelatinovora]QIZ82685.1 ParB N-terminal domain-containing protein [Thalassovita gelatinovora]SER11764.1 ParB/RepB/Spo0J family partition protein [Thalassovita gelatinovora]